MTSAVCETERKSFDAQTNYWTPAVQKQLTGPSGTGASLKQ